jgi:sugar phosphate isomerase/epimerase
MNFGFSTYFFTRKHISGVVDEIIASGLKTIEISHEIPHAPNLDLDFYTKMAELRAKGFQFSVHAPFFEINLGSFIDEVRRISVDRIKRSLDMARDLQCDPVVVHPGYNFLTGRVKDIEERARGHFVESLQELSRYARDRGLRIALENVFMPVFFFYELAGFKVLSDIMPDLGITLDIGHAYVTKCTKGVDDPEGAIVEDIKKVGIEHIFHVHLHNNMGKKDDHTFFEGRIDMKRILKTLAAEGYSGKVIIESYDMEERGMDAVLSKLHEITP